MRVLIAFFACAVGAAVVPARVADTRTSAGLTEVLVVALAPRGGVGQAHLWLLNPAMPAAPLRPLTSGEVIDGNPAVSPDGRWVAFSRASVDGSLRQHIWIQSMVSGHARPLTSGLEDSAPFWSNDGRTLGFFRSNVTAESVSSRTTLYVIEPFAGTPQPRRLLSEQAPSQFLGSWNPHGGDLLVGRIADDRNLFSIWRLSVRGGEPVEVISRGCCGAAQPAYSPDGTRIAYVSNTHNERGDVYVANADGSHPTRVTCESGWGSPAWAPAGGELMATRAGSAVRLWRMPVPPPDGACVRPTGVSSLPVVSYTWARLAR